MAGEHLERHETDIELNLYRECRDVLSMYRYVVETGRRFYLSNHVDVQTRYLEGANYLEIGLDDAWVWDGYRPARFLKRVTIMTFGDVKIEEITQSELLS